MPIDYHLDEVDADFVRLATDLDRQKIIAFAQQRSLLLHSPDKLVHLAAVADLAQRYVDVVYGKGNPIESSYWKKACEAAGFLHETMMLGCSFEEVVDISDALVARLVANTTGDQREPLNKRADLLSNRLALADTACRLIKLADLRHDLALQQKLAETDPNPVRLWIEEAEIVVNGLRQLQTTGLRSRYKALVEAIVDLEVVTRPNKKKKG